MFIHFKIINLFSSQTIDTSISLLIKHNIKINEHHSIEKKIFIFFSYHVIWIFCTTLSREFNHIVWHLIKITLDAFEVPWPVVILLHFSVKTFYCSESTKITLFELEWEVLSYCACVKYKILKQKLCTYAGLKANSRLQVIACSYRVMIIINNPILIQFNINCQVKLFSSKTIILRSREDYLK